MTDPRLQLLIGDCRETLATLPAESVQCCVTSPPYFGLRDYGTAGQIGLERTPDEFVSELVKVFREVRRVLKADGTLWLNLGDSYAAQGAGKQGANGQRAGRRHTQLNLRNGHQSYATPKNLLGMPWRVAFALQADGWVLRQDIIWHKPNPMPESVRDRCTKAHEYLFLLSKSQRYHYDADAIAEPATESSIDRVSQATWDDQAGSSRVPGKTNGPMKAVLRKSGNKSKFAPGYPRDERPYHGVPWEGATANKRSVWTVTTQPFTSWARTSRQVHVASGVLSDGMTHRASEDCPLHGSFRRQGSIPERDEREVQSSGHNGSTPPNLGLLPSTDSAPIHQPRAPLNEEQNSGSLLQPCSSPAIGRSKRSRKTGRDPETNLSCKACAQNQSRTLGTSGSLSPSAPRPCTCGSNTAEGESGDSPSNQNRLNIGSTPVSPELFGASVESLRENGCLCEFYREVTEKTSHFATFPPALVEPCILAGSREGDTILDPFGGSGTTAGVAIKHGRKAILCELNPAYAAMVDARVRGIAEYEFGLFAEPEPPLRTMPMFEEAS